MSSCNEKLTRILLSFEVETWLYQLSLLIAGPEDQQPHQRSPNKRRNDHLGQLICFDAMPKVAMRWDFFQLFLNDARLLLGR